MDKIVPKSTALPTIFSAAKEKTSEEKSAEEKTKENQAATIKAEEEIQFLRVCVAGLERECESIKEQLQMKIDAKDSEISLLKEKVCRLEEINSKFQTELAAFAIDDNEKVVIFSVFHF